MSFPGRRIVFQLFGDDDHGIAIERALDFLQQVVVQIPQVFRLDPNAQRQRCVSLRRKARQAQEGLFRLLQNSVFSSSNTL